MENTQNSAPALNRTHLTAAIWGVASLALALFSQYVYLNADDHFGEYLIYLFTLLCIGSYIGTVCTPESETLRTFFLKWKKVTTVILAVFAVGFVLLSFACHSDQVSFKEKYVIVLGAPVREQKISTILLNRVDTAADFLRKSPEAVAILTGGNSPYEDYSGLVAKMTTEGAFMSLALVEEGISPERLIVEDRATTTEENFQYSLELLKDAGYREGDTVVIITNLFHTYRVRTLAKESGLQNFLVHAANTSVLDAIPWYVREIPVSFVFFFQHTLPGLFRS